MPGFVYTGGKSGGNRLRHYLNISGDDRQTHVGLFLLPQTLGTLSVTGCGFEPDAVVMFGHMQDEFNEDYATFQVGVATADGNQWGGSIFGNYLGTAGISKPWKNANWSDSAILAGLKKNDPDFAEPWEAELISFDADGFTLDITEVPWLDNTGIIYLAIKGEGSYTCGTALSSGGSQSITGLGFEPTGIFFASAQLEALGYFAGWHRLTMGAGTILVNTNVWSGAESNDVYHDSIATTNKVLSMFRETNAGTPFDPVLLSEASITSMDADGFTLDWDTSDSIDRYYSWFAMEGLTEVNFWNFLLNTSYEYAPGFTGWRQDTIYPPKGLIFYANDLGSTTRDYPSTAGDAMGLGVCDYDFNQWHIGYMTVSPPAIGNNQISSSYVMGDAIGSHERRSSAFTAPDNGHDIGHVVAWLRRRIPQVIRYR